MPLEYPIDNQSKGVMENTKFREIKALKFKGGLSVFAKTPTYTGINGEIVLCDAAGSMQICVYLNNAWQNVDLGIKSVVRVGLSAPQTITAGNTDLIAFDREDYDTNNEFNTSTNRFTPTTAGYYQVHCNLYFNTEVNTFQLFLYKNGVVFLGSRNNGVGYTWFLTDIVYMNGTTDYLEMYCYAIGGDKILQGGGTTNTTTTLTIHKI